MGMGDPPEPRPEQPIGDRPTPAASRRQHIKSGVLLAITGVSIYLLLPSLLSVLSSWPSLKHLDWPFAVLVLLFELASWICLWELDRIALGSTGWFTIACGQLAGNALGRIIPGSATPFTVVMLRKAGVDGGDAAAALTASTGLQIATALALPVLAVPAILGGAPIDHGLAMAAYLGIAVVLLLVGTGAVLLTTDAPLQRVGGWMQSLLNVTVRRRRPVEGLPEELISDRNLSGRPSTADGRPLSSRPPGTRASTTSRSCAPCGRSEQAPGHRSWCSPTRPQNCWHRSPSHRGGWGSWRPDWSAR